MGAQPQTTGERSVKKTKAVSNAPSRRARKAHRGQAAKAAGPTAHDYDRFYSAAANLIRKSGGTAVVATGIRVIQFPGDKEFQYTFGVQIVGRKPPYRERPHRSDGGGQ
jgi:hypothetical protein